MLDERFSNHVAYCCIFSKTTGEAADNLLRLITTGHCGFHQGAAAWLEFATTSQRYPDELSSLNRFGASFTTTQWQEILERIANGLSRPVPP
jgi:hypothetical protein